MNTDPPGTDENQIDVFVLCGNSSDATLLSQQLPPHGYRVTLFSDITHLFESIRAGKPNLLICDAAGTEPDGCEFCREIKTDYDLWLIPVLLITGVSGLPDLLKVLDSNADNFIARPYDLAELLPLIESMIAERAEKPDPEKVKTRFKIRHDDRDYVIMADRRKLLDFLLSSYELAVNRAQDLARVQGKFEDLIEELEIRVKNRTQSLSDEVERLEALVKEHSRALDQKEGDLHQQEAREKELLQEILENEAAISRGAAALTKIAGELDQSRSRCAEAEEQICTLTRDKEVMARSLQDEIDALRTAHDAIRADLDVTKRAHGEALDQISSHEVRHADLATEKEQTETTLRSCSLELDALKTALAKEKDRATAAERELQSVKGAKADLEQELKKRINDLTGKVKEQADELIKQKKLLDTETERRTAFGQQLQALTQEKEKCEAALGAERQSLREQRDALQEKFDTANASLGAERQKTATLSGELQSSSVTHEKLLGELHIATRRLEIAETASEEEKQLRLASEKNAKEALAAKAEAETSYQKLLRSLHEDKKTYNEELALANQELDTVQSTRKRLEDELADAVLARVQSEKFAESLSHDMEQLRAALETERRERRTLEEKLKEEKRAKDHSEKQLHTFTSEKGLLYDTLAQKFEKLSDDFEKEIDQHRILEQQLAAAAQQQSDKEMIVQELTQKIEQVQTAYVADKKHLLEIQELLARERQAKELAEQHLQSVTEEKTREHDNLVIKLQKLADDFEKEISHKKSLEQELDAVAQQYAEKEDGAKTLSKEFAQLQAAYEAGQQELHYTREQLAEMRNALAWEKTRIQPAAQESPAIVPNHALTLKGPDLPRVVEQGKHSLSVVDSVQPHRDLVAVPDKPPVPPAAQVPDERPPGDIQGVEDLFEDEPGMDITELPDATIEPKAASENVGTDPNAKKSEIPAGPVEQDDDAVETDIPVEDKKRSTPGTLDKYGVAPVQGNRQFDRQQWFDLVRWAHNTPSLSREEKLRFVRLGRLMQKGRKLTRTQDEQVTELVSLAYSMGFKAR